MGAALAAVAIIALISFVSIPFRGFACFNLVMIGAAMLIVSDFWFWPGVVMFGGGILILFLTSLKAEPSRRLHYMFHMFIYGMISFLRMFMICTILLMPVAGMLAAVGSSHKEVAVMDLASGMVVGRTVIDERGRDIEGRQYRPIDNDPY